METQTNNRSLLRSLRALTLLLALVVAGACTSDPVAPLPLPEPITDPIEPWEIDVNLGDRH